MLSYIVDFFAVLCAGVGLFYFLSIPQKSIRALIICLAFGTAVELIYDFVPSLSGVPIRLFYCLFCPVQYAVYGYLLRDYSHITNRAWGLFTLAGLSLFSIYQIAFQITDRSAATSVFLVMSILTIILVLDYFYGLVRSNRVLYMSSEPAFWIATALLFLLTGNIVATGFYHKFRANPSMASVAKNLFIMNYVLSVLKAILFSIAFVVAARKPHHA